MIGEHSVLYSADPRLITDWSAVLNANPDFGTDLSSWWYVPTTLNHSYQWSNGQAVTKPGTSNGASIVLLSTAAGAQILRPANVTTYRLTAQIDVRVGDYVRLWICYQQTNTAPPNIFPVPAGTVQHERTIQVGSPGVLTVSMDDDAQAVDPAAYPYVAVMVAVGRSVPPNSAPFTIDGRWEFVRLTAQASPEARTDLSCFVDSLTIHHGRDDTESQCDASSCTLDIATDTSEAPLPDIDVGGSIQVSTALPGVGSFLRFTGRVTDITQGWDDAGEETPDASIVQVICTSILADLGRHVVGDLPWPQQLDGARVAAILAAAGTVLDPGTSDPGTVQILPRDVDSQPALDLAQEVASDAGGLLWETRAGDVRYADADHRRGTGVALSVDSCDVLVTPTWRRTTEGLINKVSIGYGPTPDGGEQPRYLAQDDASIQRFGTYSLSASTQLAAQADGAAMGQLLLVRNSEPVWIMSALPVDVDSLSIDDTAALLGLDVNDLLDLTGMPAAGSVPTSAVLWVEGWTETLAWQQHDFELVVSGYCRTVPPPRWDDIPPSWTWDSLGGTVMATNLIINPSLETGLTWWATWAGVAPGAATTTQETSGGKFGAAFRRVTFTAVPASGGGHFVVSGAPFIPVVAGTRYRGGAWVRPSVTLDISQQWQFYADGTPTTGSSMQRLTCPANQWSWVPTDFTVPAGSNQVQLRWYVAGSGITAVGQTLDIDGAILAASTTPVDYFDGDTPASGGNSYRWTGTPHNSTSEWRQGGSDLTWDDMTCIGPLPTSGRWNDVPATLRWQDVAPAITWDTADMIWED